MKFRDAETRRRTNAKVKLGNCPRERERERERQDTHPKHKSLERIGIRDP